MSKPGVTRVGCVGWGSAAATTRAGKTIGETIVQLGGLSMMKRLRVSRGSQGREGGFTLVELLMVMVIVGILAGIGVSGFSSLRDRADRSAADSAWRELNLALQMIQAAYDDRPIGDDALVATRLNEFISDPVEALTNNLWNAAADELPATNDKGDLVAPNAGESGYAITASFHCVWVKGKAATVNPEGKYPLGCINDD